jgi:hypothetical protein
MAFHPTETVAYSIMAVGDAVNFCCVTPQKQQQ